MKAVTGSCSSSLWRFWSEALLLPCRRRSIWGEYQGEGPEIPVYPGYCVSLVFSVHHAQSPARRDNHTAKPPVADNSGLTRLDVSRGAANQCPDLLFPPCIAPARMLCTGWFRRRSSSPERSWVTGQVVLSFGLCWQVWRSSRGSGLLSRSQLHHVPACHCWGPWQEPRCLHGVMDRRSAWLRWLPRDLYLMPRIQQPCLPSTAMWLAGIVSELNHR